MAKKPKTATVIFNDREMTVEVIESEGHKVREALA